MTIRMMCGGGEEEEEMRRNPLSSLRLNILTVPAMMTKRRAKKNILVTLRRPRFIAVVIYRSRNRPLLVFLGMINKIA
jgi:hypothetical protein